MATRAWPRRIGAADYVLGMAILASLWAIAAWLTCRSTMVLGLLAGLGHDALSWLLLAYGLGVLLLSWPLAESRMRDLDLPVQTMLLLLRIPFTAPLVWMALCRPAGARRDNDHGAAPAPSGVLKRCAALATACVAASLLVFAGAACVDAQSALAAAAAARLSA